MSHLRPTVRPRPRPPTGGGRRAQHGVGDPDRPRAVGEGRQAVDGVASNQRRWRGRCRRRRRRSSPGSPAGGRAGRGVRGGRRVEVRRIRWRSARMPPRRPSHRVSGCSWSKASVASVPVTSKPELVLVAGRDLADHHRAADTRRRCGTGRGDVLGGDGAPTAGAPPLDSKAWAWASRARRSWHRGDQLGAHRRQPVAGHELDEVAPVGADVGEGPRPPGQRRVDSPVVVVLGGQPVLQVGAVDEAERAGIGRDAGPGLAHHRVEAVDERHRRHDARRRRPRRTARRPPHRRGRAASRTRRACPPRARRGPAARGGGWACRCAPRRCPATTTSSSASTKPRSAPSRSTASLRGGGCRGGHADDEPAPARRAASAWTLPMKPAPTTPTRSVRSGS